MGYEKIKSAHLGLSEFEESAEHTQGVLKNCCFVSWGSGEGSGLQV